MKVVIMANFDMGLYKFRKELVNELNKKNEVVIVVPKGDYNEYFENIGCRVINIELERRGRNPISEIKLLTNLWKIVSKEKPDWILTYTIKPNLYGGIISRIKHIPYIANITGLGSAVETKSILQKILLVLYKYALGKANCVFCQNKENSSFLSNNGIAKGKHVLIPGSGVNLDEFAFMEYPSTKTIKFLYVSRIMKEKGIEELLEASKKIKNKYNDIEFHILGFCEQEYESLIKEYVDKNIVEYHGLQKDTRPFLEICNCVIHPSYYPEGMSNVCLEGAASGRVVITTDRSGCFETVDDGRTGYIVKQKDVDDLVDKIEKFIHLTWDEKKQMAINAREKMEKEFDRNIVVQAYLDVMEKNCGL